MRGYQDVNQDGPSLIIEVPPPPPLPHCPQIYCTPFTFTFIKVHGFEIMTYSRLFNFAVSYQNYFTIFYTNVVFFYTNYSRNPVC